MWETIRVWPAIPIVVDPIVLATMFVRRGKFYKLRFQCLLPFMLFASYQDRKRQLELYVSITTHPNRYRILHSILPQYTYHGRWVADSYNASRRQNITHRLCSSRISLFRYHSCEIRASCFLNSSEYKTIG